VLLRLPFLLLLLLLLSLATAGGGEGISFAWSHSSAIQLNHTGAYRPVATPLSLSLFPASISQFSHARDDETGTDEAGRIDGRAERCRRTRAAKVDVVSNMYDMCGRAARLRRQLAAAQRRRCARWAILTRTVGHLSCIDRFRERHFPSLTPSRRTSHDERRLTVAVRSGRSSLVAVDGHLTAVFDSLSSRRRSRSCGAIKIAPKRAIRNGVTDESPSAREREDRRRLSWTSLMPSARPSIRPSTRTDGRRLPAT